MKNKIIFGFSAVIALMFYFSSVTHAATLYFLPDVKNLGVGGEFRINLDVDTQNDSVNAVQATVKFPSSVVKLLDFDKSSSVFNFWLEEPVISNENGTVKFTAGTAKGVSGAALNVISFHFKTVGAGIAEISVTDAAVTASDGSGTNVLSSVKNAKIGVEIGILSPSVSVAEIPQKITRSAVSAKGLPDKPVFRVPLYPDQSRWYSQVGNVIALWDLPADITQVSARLTRSQEAQAGIPETELFNGKDFGIIKEGVWYARVQFKNNIGWGEPAYYKISVDTTAPLPFNIKIDSAVSDNPSPEISYETNDSLSGISEYLIKIDGKEIFKTASSSLTLPLQLPGKRTLTVRAVDLAGNGIEDSLQFEILPIESPVIQFYPSSVPSGQLLFVSGKSLPLSSVEVHLINSQNQEVAFKKVKSDEVGHWEFSMGEFLPTGIYYLNAVAKDSRGASSYPAGPVKIKITEKVIFSIGIFDFGWFEIFLMGVVIVSALGIYFYRRRIFENEKRAAYRIIAGRDFQNLILLLEKDISELRGIDRKYPLVDDKIRTEREYFYGKIGDMILRIKKYIGDELKKIK